MHLVGLYKAHLAKKTDAYQIRVWIGSCNSAMRQILVGKEGEDA